MKRSYYQNMSLKRNVKRVKYGERHIVRSLSYRMNHLVSYMVLFDISLKCEAAYSQTKAQLYSQCGAINIKRVSCYQEKDFSQVLT